MDLKRREIPDWVSGGIAALFLMHAQPECLLGLIPALFFLVAAVKGGIGGGDVKLAAACGLVLGLPGALMECQMQKCMCLRNTGKSRGFVGMDAEYIAGLFVVEGHQGHGTGHQLISEVKRKNRLSLHAYEKNAGAVAFYQAEGFHIENSMTEKETGEQEYRMVFHESDESKESCSK